MCVCDRVANNERCEKKERTERKGSSLLILIRNDKGKKPKKNQKKKQKRNPFSLTIWSRMMERKKNVSSCFYPFIERRRPTPKGNASNKCDSYDDDAMLL